MNRRSFFNKMFAGAVAFLGLGSAAKAVSPKKTESVVSIHDAIANLGQIMKIQVAAKLSPDGKMVYLDGKQVFTIVVVMKANRGVVKADLDDAFAKHPPALVSSPENRAWTGEWHAQLKG